jgi:DNA polymerase V
MFLFMPYSWGMNISLPIAGDAPGPIRSTVPFFDQAVAAGFPSSAADHAAVGLDLQALLIRHPAASFMLRVAGDSMVGAGILDGDLAIVDRAVEARPGHVVVAVLDGAFVMKRLRLRGGRLFLDAENPKFRSCVAPTESGFEIWGVVVATIRRLVGDERGG